MRMRLMITPNNINNILCTDSYSLLRPIIRTHNNQQQRSQRPTT
jgi:hypothetical protein